MARARWERRGFLTLALTAYAAFCAFSVAAMYELAELPDRPRDPEPEPDPPRDRFAYHDALRAELRRMPPWPPSGHITRHRGD